MRDPQTIFAGALGKQAATLSPAALAALGSVPDAAALQAVLQASPSSAPSEAPAEGTSEGTSEGTGL